MTDHSLSKTLKNTCTVSPVLDVFLVVVVVILVVVVDDDDSLTQIRCQCCCSPS
jgi:hypothetical protein